jgi:cytochrome subunit of sulfide dehydrogenase
MPFKSQFRVCATALTITAALLAALPSAVMAQATVSKHLGRNLAAQCANCHGTNGKSADVVPSLAGQSAEDLVKKMQNYRDGKMPGTIMHQLAKGYSDEQVALIADYLSKQAK